MAIAGAAADAFGLKKVLFAPTGRQPLKPGGAQASFADRLAMVALACAPDSRFAVSELDGPRADGRPNYTVDALSALKRSLPEAKIYTVIGADSFLEFPRWHEAGMLLELSEWIVVSRPGFALRDPDLLPMERTRVHRLETVMEDVSARELRLRLSVDDPCIGLIRVEVVDYIAEHGLYGYTCMR